MTIDDLQKNYYIKINDLKKTITLSEYIGVNKNITIPSVIDGYNIILNENAFKSKNINNVIIEEGITTIPCGCFCRSSIKTITLPKSVKEIENAAFANCKKLKNIDISNIEYIQHSVFRDAGIKKIDFPDIKTIPPYICFGCKDLTSITLSPATKKIGSSAFRQTSIKTIDLKNVKLLDSEVFYMCNDLTSINCSNVTDVNDYAFAMCNNLTKFDFPKLNNLGEHAFVRCGNIEKIIIKSDCEFDECALASCTIDEMIIMKNANLHNCFLDTKIKQLRLYGDENEIKFNGYTNIEINELTIFKNAKVYTNSLNDSYMPKIEVLGSVELIKNDEDGNFKNVMFNLYNQQNFKELDDIKYNKRTNFDELQNKGFSLQQINQILKAQQHSVLLSGINPIISLEMIRNIIEINNIDTEAVDKIKLIACDQKLKPLDYEIKMNEVISKFYNSMLPNKEGGKEHDDR